MSVASMQMLVTGDTPGYCTPVLRRAYSQSPLLIKKLPRVTSSYGKQRRIKINVSGTIYETLESTLERYPDTILGDKLKRARYYDHRDNYLFFDRNRIAFEAILFYYQSSGYLIRPVDMTIEDFERECVFYGLEESDILSMKEREGYARQPEPKPKHNNNNLRSRLYQFLEYPNSSKRAGVFAVFSMLMIVGSIFTTCVTTLPDINRKYVRGSFNWNPFSIAEFAMNLFFGLEYLLKLFSTPESLKFIRSPMNLIDLFAVFPYFIIFAIDARQVSNLGFTKAFRTVRVLRLLRFSRHSDTLRVVINILSSSVRDLFTVVFCMLLMSVVWGSLAFYVEVGSTGTQFTSIPDGMWWAIQTIVCLGYGDIIPQTLPGKIAAAVVAVIGALTLTVPLLSIGGRYLTMYSKTFSIKSTLDNNGNEIKATKGD